MSQQIFKSCFSLEYNNKDMEQQYIQNREVKITKYIKLITILILILSIGNSIQISFFFSQFDNFNFQAVMIMSYLITFICLVKLILVFIFICKIKILKVVNYSNLFLLIFLLINFRYPIIRFYGVSPIVFYIILILEMSLRFVWFILE